jgi:hypothetical protein
LVAVHNYNMVKLPIKHMACCIGTKYTLVIDGENFYQITRY